MKRTLGMLMALAPLLSALAATDKSVVLAQRTYEISTRAGERIALMAEAIPALKGGTGVLATTQWKTVLGEFGVTWPEGSGIHFAKAMAEMVVVNTEANLKAVDKFFQDMNLKPMQVQIDAVVVAASRAALEAVGYFDLTRPAATNLYAKLRGRKDVSVIASPRMVTSSGEEVYAKGVKEYVYPTDFEVVPASVGEYCCSNHHARLPGTGVAAVEPGEFKTRDIGTLLVVTPNLDDRPTGQIELNLTFEYAKEPEVKDYGQTIPATEDHPEVKLAMELPSFPVVQVTEEVILPSGSTEVFGGVTDGTEAGKDIFYLLFVTPRAIDTAGEEVKFD